MATKQHRDDEIPITTTRPQASRRLLSAALTGLVGLAGACKDNQAKAEPDPDSIDAGVADAPEVQDAAPPVDAAPIDAAPPDAGSKIISETKVQKTFAELTAECDARGGYTQIHAACAGSNACAGFSYGDWGEDAVLTEHTCAGVNGCNGLSCVVLPADSGKTAEQILAADLPEDGPRSCKNCHAEWTDDGVDTSKFKIYVLGGSGRDASNWLDVPAAAQERIIAFGKTGVYTDGTAYSHMAAYHKIYSRAEIRRVVQHIRTTSTIVIKEIKVTDAP
jgi:hypothetical protein